MSNKSAVRGSKFERDLLAYLRAAGWPTERLARTGSLDEGDLLTFDPMGKRVVIEAKALRQFDLASAINELTVERQHYADARGLGLTEVDGIAVLKRPGKGIGQAYVVMELDRWMEYR